MNIGDGVNCRGRPFFITLEMWLGEGYWQHNFGRVNWASESQYKFLRAFKQEAGDGLSKCDARLAAVQVRQPCAKISARLGSRRACALLEKI